MSSCQIHELFSGFIANRVSFTSHSVTKAIRLSLVELVIVVVTFDRAASIFSRLNDSNMLLK